LSKIFRILIFLAILLLIVFVQRYWFVTAWNAVRATASPGTRLLAKVLFFGCVATVLATLIDPFVSFLPDSPFGSWLLALTRLWLMASLLAFLAVKSVGGVEWASRSLSASPHHSDFNPQRRAFFHYVALLAGSLPFVAATYGVAAGRRRYTVENVEVPIAGLPAALDGFTIVQLSDIHIGDFMPRDEVARAVDIANDLGPDLAVITGDFVSDHTDPLEDCIAELSRLRAPLGVWGCNGNHEIYAGAEAVAGDLFQARGMKLLRQESAVLTWHGAPFNLIGVDYQRDRMTPGPHGVCLQRIESLVRHDMPNILLSHNPNSFPRAAELGIDLSLAGHTHGGQVKFEIVDHTISPARLITDYVAGLYRRPMNNGNSRKDAFLYVNRGLGTFGFPVRLGVPPEITLLTLRSGPPKLG
jgi:predicted MPP superfamily phosphohydrolase